MNAKYLVRICLLIAASAILLGEEKKNISNESIAKDLQALKERYGDDKHAYVKAYTAYIKNVAIALGGEKMRVKIEREEQLLKRYGTPGMLYESVENDKTIWHDGMAWDHSIKYIKESKEYQVIFVLKSSKYDASKLREKRGIELVIQRNVHEGRANVDRFPLRWEKKSDGCYLVRMYIEDPKEIEKYFLSINFSLESDWELDSIIPLKL